MQDGLDRIRVADAGRRYEKRSDWVGGMLVSPSQRAWVPGIAFGPWGTGVAGVCDGIVGVGVGGSGESI